MTTEPSTPAKPATSHRTITVVSIIVLCFFAFCLGIEFPFGVAFQMVAGWIWYLGRTIPSLTISVERTAWFLGALILFAVGIHFACRAFYQRNAIEPATQQTASRWNKCWTLTLVTMFLMLVMIGICVVSIMHQAWWMTTSDALVFSGSREAARRSTSKNNLKQIGLALEQYHDDFHQLPIGGTFSDTGQPQHSWVSQLLSYLDGKDLFQQIDFHQPWTAEANRKPFQTRINAIQNPGMKSESDDGKSSQAAFQGYQPAHYAANSRVFNVNSGMNFKEITDGTSNTLLAGEIKSDIKPWGDPTNFRDPALGINQSPHGFESPFIGGAIFLLGDGTVRFLSEDIDPAVLKALSTPNGGETVGEF